jgi:1-acyl-sn-glycerol-3-phosphate acyltransferase
VKVKQTIRSLLKGSAFAFFWSGGVALSWVALPLVFFGRESQKKRARIQELLRLGFVAFHDYMRVTRLIDYDPRKTGLDLPAGPFVVIANHPTLVDVTAIMSACGGLACVVKEEHYNGKMVGRLLRHCGHINGGDGSPLASGAVVIQALERLAAGQSVLIFPEGTRSPPGGLGKFFRGAFEIARRAGVPVVPLILTCEPPTLMKGEKWYELPEETCRLEVRLFEGLTPEDFQGSSKEVASRIEARYRQEVGTGNSPGAAGADRT